MIMALGATLAGCTDSLLTADSGDPEDMGQGTDGPGSGACGVGGDEGGTTAGLDSSFEGGSFEEGGGSTGSVDEGTSIGLTDDLPLAVDIPDIQRGELPVGSWVVIEQVPASSGRASLGNHEWFYVQDPLAEAYMGLRVEVIPGDTFPEPERWLDLVGRVREDSNGWLLQLESITEGSIHEGVQARPIDVAALYSSTADELDDALVEVTAPDLLDVVHKIPASGVLVVRDAEGGRTMLVDLRPFDLEYLQLVPGMRLEQLTGVAEINGERPVLLPRTPEDIVLGR